MNDAQRAQLRERFAISPLIDAEIDVGGVGWAGLTANAGHSVRLSVTAAVVAELMGYKSIDRVRKQLQDAPVHMPRDALLSEICGTHLFLYDEFYRAFTPRKDERIGIFAFDLAMVRSRASIELMLITARQGFLIEPCLIARSLIEQFAYAWRVWPTDSDEIIFSSKPQSLISNLKKINSQAGRAYGMLSQLAHYDPTMHHSFIGQLNEDDDSEENSTVTQRSWKFKVTSLAWVFFVLDLKYRIFRACYGSYSNFDELAKIHQTILPAFDLFFNDVSLNSLRQIRSLIAAE